MYRHPPVRGTTCGFPWTTVVRLSMAGPAWHCAAPCVALIMALLGDLMLQLQSAFGIVALLAFAWVISENRRAVSVKQAAIGLAVTLVTAIILIKLPFVARGFGAINDAVGAIASATRAGTSFVFVYLGGGQLQFDPKKP